MPSPAETLPRIGDSPIPTTTTLWSDSETAIAPTDPVLKNLSVMFSQFDPASVVFHTPPPVAPNQNVAGSPRTPHTAVTRPAR